MFIRKNKVQGTPTSTIFSGKGLTYAASTNTDFVNAANPVLELPAKQHCQFVPYTKKLGKMG